GGVGGRPAVSPIPWEPASEEECPTFDRRICPGAARRGWYRQLQACHRRRSGGGEEQRAARQARPGSVVFLGRVPDAVRDALLQRATALLYPSLWEGFGLPPVEAMAVGTPVLASNTSAFPEVLSDAALLVDPFDTDAIARGIVELATSQALRATLIERGRRRAATFTPRAMAERALDAFHWAMDRAA